MNELTTERQWHKYLDEGFKIGANGMIEAGKRMHEFYKECDNKRGGTEFSKKAKEWFGMSQSLSNQWKLIGERSAKLTRISGKLPSAFNTVYEISTMSADDIANLNPQPDTKLVEVKNFKMYGTIEAPEIDVLEETEGTTEAEEAAVLVPSLELYGISDFGKKALEQDRKKVQEAINKLPATQSKKFVELFVEVLKYHQSILISEIRRQIPESIDVRKKMLDEKEKQLFERETQLAIGIPEKEKKIVYSVLHPDKAPAGMEAKYAKAFDIVRKWR